MMSVATQPGWDLRELPPVPVRRFTVEEYHQMIEAGVFAGDARFELLEGWIVLKMTRNPPHDVALGQAHDALRGLLPADWHIREQSAITTADSEPEPDLAVVRGGRRDYLGHHPGPRDLALVVEVADSTLAEDRKFKGRLYARAGVPIYWIINLVDVRIEVYTDPTGPDATPGYRQLQTSGPDDLVPLIIEGRETGRTAAREVLP
jgi:Uma2 family endonuclease